MLMDTSVEGVWGHPSSALCCFIPHVNRPERPDLIESYIQESLQLLNMEL